MNGETMKLNYIVEGEGKTLIFIHGLSDDLRYWEILTSSLKNNYKIIRIDLRGHGESELGADEICINTYANDLKKILDELKIEKANVIGFSLGGAVAIDFAIRYPDYVSSLVLMSTFLKCDDYLSKLFSQFKEELNKSFEDFFDFMIEKVLCPEVIEKNREELEILKQISSQNTNLEAYEKAVDACINFNAEKSISNINVPTLILAGKYDEIIPLDKQKLIHKSISSSDLIVFDDVRHNLLVGKNNAEIIKILNNFYKNH